MSKRMPCVVVNLRPLAICMAIAAAFAAAPPSAASVPATYTLGAAHVAYQRSASPSGSASHTGSPATTIAVANCADDGSAGSLRFAIQTAVSGDTIDASQLACSTITLESGALVVAQDSLTINGPGNGQLAITANLQDRVFTHTGTGTLILQHLSVLEGKTETSGFAAGGCIYSTGAVDLIDSQVKYCQAYGDEAADGGAIWAMASVGLNRSQVGVATAKGGTFGATAGGIFTRDFTAKYSDVGSNTVLTTGDYIAEAGGVWATGNVIISHSTIGSNTAGVVGGIVIQGGDANARAVILNSTISNNTSSDSTIGSGVYVAYATLIANSTISGNVEQNTANAKYGAGVFVHGNSALELESTAVGGNEFVTAGSTGYLPSDLGSDLDGATVTGANNLINVVTHDVVVPADSLRTTPQLGVLQNNGGNTSTQVPGQDSPLIGGGNTTANPGGCDQRGPGFPRTSSGRIDIGAVQAPPNPDTIFGDGFEALPTCAD
jgi:hypothetical protein